MRSVRCGAGAMPCKCSAQRRAVVCKVGRGGARRGGAERGGFEPGGNAHESLACVAHIGADAAAFAALRRKTEQGLGVKSGPKQWGLKGRLQEKKKESRRVK